jgi:hypothetical protein
MYSDLRVRQQILDALERFNQLISTRNPQVLEDFASGDNVLLVGSEAGEVANGKKEIKAFITRIFARETTFSWEWDRIDVAYVDDLAWFFADVRVILSTPQGQCKSPYRITGVLERRDKRRLWRQYHGSELVSE